MVDEIQEFDAKEGEEEVKRKMKDYKKTRLHKAMNVFEEFVRALEEGRHTQNMEF